VVDLLLEESMKCQPPPPLPLLARSGASSPTVVRSLGMKDGSPLRRARFGEDAAWSCGEGTTGEKALGAGLGG